MKLQFGIAMVALAGASVCASPALAQNPAARPRTAVTLFGPQTGPFLGIGGQDITAERAKALKLKEERGVEVTRVNGDSPAAKAGIKEGDVVLEYNGERVESWEQIHRLVRETPIGRQVKVVVWRNGAPLTLMATIVESKLATIGPGAGNWVMPEVRMPVPPAIPQIEVPQFQMTWPSMMLGITGESLGEEPQFAEFLGVKEGVLVKSVMKNSAAEKAGIKAGDVMVKIDDAAIAATRDITKALRSAAGKTVNVTLVRNKKEMTIPVPIAGTSRQGAVMALAEC